MAILCGVFYPEGRGTTVLWNTGNYSHDDTTKGHGRPESSTRQAMITSRNIQVRSCDQCCKGKAISIAYSETVFVAFGIQHAMCSTISPSVAWPTLHYLPPYLVKSTILAGIVCSDFLYKFWLYINHQLDALIIIYS